MGCRWTTTRLFVIALAIQGLATSRALGQTPDELQAARDLFSDAYKDEQDHHYTEALDKFTRVARVKESAAVRYRIASVLASMGRLRQARDGFRVLAGSRGSLPAGDQEIADSAVARAAELDKRIPRISIVVKDRASGAPIKGTRVTVDGAPVTAPTTTPVEVDPGSHLVAAVVSGRQPYERTVTLGDGVEIVHTVELEPEELPATSPAHTSSSTLLPRVSLAVGGALVIGSAVLLIAREGAIDDIQSDCPGNRCPAPKESEVEDNRSRAELFGPLGIGFGITGIVALSFGIYLLATSPTTATSRFAAPGMLRW